MELFPNIVSWQCKEHGVLTHESQGRTTSNTILESVFWLNIFAFTHTRLYALAQRQDTVTPREGLECWQFRIQLNRTPPSLTQTPPKLKAHCDVGIWRGTKNTCMLMVLV